MRRTQGTTNGVEMLMPCFAELYAELGIDRGDIGFWCSGSSDYLAGRAFSFISAIDSIGAVPPINESHVEMDAAWALYEAYIKLLTGEVDTALVYGFGKSSAAHCAAYWPCRPTLHRRAALARRCVPGRLQARIGLDSGKWTAEQMAQVALDTFAVAERTDAEKGATSVGELLDRPLFADPLRKHDIAPITDGAAAIVLAAGDRARELRERPAWISGFEHRIETPVLGARDLTTSPSTSASAKIATGEDTGSIDVAELYAPFTHQHLILTEAIGLSSSTKVNPSGGALAANPMFATGLERIGFAARRIFDGSAQRALAHSTSGPALQQNLVAVLEGETDGGPTRRGAGHRADEIRRETHGRLDERSGSRSHRPGPDGCGFNVRRHRRRCGRQGARPVRGRDDARTVHGRCHGSHRKAPDPGTPPDRWAARQRWWPPALFSPGSTVACWPSRGRSGPNQMPCGRCRSPSRSPSPSGGRGRLFRPARPRIHQPLGAPEPYRCDRRGQDHLNGARNPLAHLHEPDITLDKVMQSPMLWDPIRFAETCPPPTAPAP